MSDYAKAECERLNIDKQVIGDLIERGTKTTICQGMATLYCYCLENDGESGWAGLNVVVSNQTDTIVSVFFLLH